MRNASGCVASCVVAMLVLLAGCGGHHKQAVNVAAAPGPKATVNMKASSFNFDPAVITARAGETLVLNVTNVSGEKHNITVKDPSGKVIADVDMAGHQTVSLEVPLPVAGVYPFYCDIDLHATLGMKGRIEVQ
jgi:plastocyanin